MSWKYTGQTLIKARPEEIWPYISTLEGFKQWYIRDGRLDPNPGGEFFQIWNEQVRTMCTVEEIVPNERFSFRWKWTIDTRVDIWFEIEEGTEGVYVHIDHGDFPQEKDFEEVYHAYVKGWTMFLYCLKARVMFGVDIRDQWAW